MLMPKSKAPKTNTDKGQHALSTIPIDPRGGSFCLRSCQNVRLFGPQSTECLECRRMCWRNAVSHQRMIKFKTNKLELVRVDRLKEVLIQHCYACSLCISIANHPTHTNKQLFLGGFHSRKKSSSINKIAANKF